MGRISRRSVLLASCSAAALGSLFYVSSSLGVVAPDFFHGIREKKLASFSEARGMIKSIVDQEMGLSQRDFDVKYSPADATRIHTRVWDQTQYALSEYYEPIEKTPQ